MSARPDDRVADRADDDDPLYLAPGEQRLVLHGVTFDQYSTVRDALDGFGSLQMTYLEGTLEIMSPSSEHEIVSRMLGRLLETWALETDTRLNGYGSTTFRRRAKALAVEPDGCYCLGRTLGKRPDLAIEVTLSRSVVRKLDVYAALGVPEVWVWRRDRVTIHVLADGRYHTAERSRLLPTLDLDLLVRFVRVDDHTAAARAYRDALRS
jgi:Uma2 family endonuclease